MSYSSTILAEASLQSYWRLDETGATAADSKGVISGAYTNNGGMVEGVTGLISSDTDTAVSVNATFGDYVDFGNNYNFASTANFSAELWCKPTALASGGDGRFLWCKRTTAGSGWAVLVDAAGFYFRRYDSGAVFDECNAGITPATGNTYHIVATYDGTTMSLYANAGTPGTVGSTRLITAGTAPLRIGAFSAGGSGYTGTLDEAAIYNAALSSGSVSTHYAAAFRIHPYLDVTISN